MPLLLAQDIQNNTSLADIVVDGRRLNLESKNLELKAESLELEKRALASREKLAKREMVFNAITQGVGIAGNLYRDKVDNDRDDARLNTANSQAFQRDAVASELRKREATHASKLRVSETDQIAKDKLELESSALYDEAQEKRITHKVDLEKRLEGVKLESEKTSLQNQLKFNEDSIQRQIAIKELASKSTSKLERQSAMALLKSQDKYADARADIESGKATKEQHRKARVAREILQGDIDQFLEVTKDNPAITKSEAYLLLNNKEATALYLMENASGQTTSPLEAAGSTISKVDGENVEGGENTGNTTEGTPDASVQTPPDTPRPTSDANLSIEEIASKKKKIAEAMASKPDDKVFQEQGAKYIQELSAIQQQKDRLAKSRSRGGSRNASSENLTARRNNAREIFEGL